MDSVEYKMLIMFDTKANSNKFYEMRLDASGTTHIKFGRVGAGSQSTSYSGGLAKFNSLLKSKLKKGYVEAELEVVDAGSGKVQVKNNVIEVALKQIKYLDDASKTMVERIAKENIHNITSNTNIKFDVEDGLFKTPLGIVKKTGVEKAMLILNEISTLLLVNPPALQYAQHEAELFALNESYFVLIPNKVKYANDKNYLLFSEANVEKQREICKALLETLDLIEELKERAENNSSEDNEEQVFKVTIGKLEDSFKYKQIEDYYHNSKKSMHGNRINSSKILNIFKIEIEDQLKPFQQMQEKIGNVQELFHGTRLANLLSILAKGLILPNDSPATKAGAMLGLGVYFANNSSKSAGYCDGGYWSGGNGSKIYMFVASVAMGKSYTPHAATGSDGKPPVGYDSFHAKAGVTGVLKNDEIVVFDLDQVRLDYLLEIEV